VDVGKLHWETGRVDLEGGQEMDHLRERVVGEDGVEGVVGEGGGGGG